MVHKGVTTQWVGTAIDALQHPRRWNIWLLTRSQNSLALPPPYGAAAGEARVDSVGINTHSQRSTFPPSREPASAAHWKLLPRLHKEVRAGVGEGGGGVRASEWRHWKSGLLWLHLDGEDLTLSCVRGPLLVKPLRLSRCRKCGRIDVSSGWFVPPSLTACFIFLRVGTHQYLTPVGPVPPHQVHHIRCWWWIFHLW